MNTQTKKSNGIAVQSKLKAGSLTTNHNQSGIMVRSKVKAGSLTSNHNQN